MALIPEQVTSSIHIPLMGYQFHAIGNIGPYELFLLLQVSSHIMPRQKCEMGWFLYFHFETNCSNFAHKGTNRLAVESRSFFIRESKWFLG
jgi:hypothetical protein